ncbi:hypothetical protein Bbelb_365810 [Branchiostoma belcheri]|nr:hypothetical protein Bbelb_365810 [Branchiostoma belcheri]
MAATGETDKKGRLALLCERQPMLRCQAAVETNLLWPKARETAAGVWSCGVAFHFSLGAAGKLTGCVSASARSRATFANQTLQRTDRQQTERGQRADRARTESRQRSDIEPNESQKRADIEPRADRQWTESGQTADRERTDSRQSADREPTGRGLTADRELTDSRQRADR